MSVMDSIELNVTYRDYGENDFGDLCEMVFSLYKEDPEGQPVSADKINLTICESIDFPEKLRIVMICVDEAVIGYCLLCFVWSNEYGGDILNIDEMYIKKEYRNQSIASDFIRGLMDSGSNIAALAVETTPSNDAALKLYERLGFEASANKHMVIRLNK